MTLMMSSWTRVPADVDSEAAGEHRHGSDDSGPSVNPTCGLAVSGSGSWRDATGRPRAAAPRCHSWCGLVELAVAPEQVVRLDPLLGDHGGAEREIGAEPRGRADLGELL